MQNCLLPKIHFIIQLAAESMIDISMLFSLCKYQVLITF